MEISPSSLVNTLSWDLHERGVMMIINRARFRRVFKPIPIGKTCYREIHEGRVVRNGYGMGSWMSSRVVKRPSKEARCMSERKALS